MNKKGIFCLLVIASMTLSFVLTACGGDNKNSDKTTQDMNQQLAEEETSDVIADEKKTDVDVADGSSSAEDAGETADTKDFPFIDF